MPSRFLGGLSELIMDLLTIAHQHTTELKKWPEFKAGDTVTVTYKIIEGNKEREQLFQGVVLQRKGTGPDRKSVV